MIFQTDVEQTQNNAKKLYILKFIKGSNLRKLPYGWFMGVNKCVIQYRMPLLDSTTNHQIIN